ncbi:MAG: helix-turn-helix transcriptional regulator, partial [Bacteroidales bacterium]|nr:helix-turn-helix transcriptional regulator [Bacteroidales bacterium]
TLTEYIIEYRLGHAARLILDTSMTISEICFDSGFNNIANFGRLFKKKHGMTPKEFRHLYKKNKYVL